MPNLVVALLDLPGVVYVRPVEFSKGTAYGLFAADGKQVGIFPTRELAFLNARMGDLVPVSVH